MKVSGANPALAKAEPVTRLGPSGFDPGEGAVQRLRRRINSIVGGHGFVTLSAGDARELLRAAEIGEMLDSIDATGGKIKVKFPKDPCQ